MTTSSFPGLGRYAALGSILAARNNAMAAQTQAGPTYMNPQLGGGSKAPVAPQQNMGVAPMAGGQAPGIPQEPSEITPPPAPVSSMLRDVKPNSMAGQAQRANQKQRGMI